MSCGGAQGRARGPLRPTFGPRSKWPRLGCLPCLALAAVARRRRPKPPECGGGGRRLRIAGRKRKRAAIEGSRAFWNGSPKLGRNLDPLSNSTRDLNCSPPVSGRSASRSSRDEALLPHPPGRLFRFGMDAEVRSRHPATRPEFPREPRAIADTGVDSPWPPHMYCIWLYWMSLGAFLLAFLPLLPALRA